MFIENKNLRSLFILLSFLLIPLTVIICLGIGRYSLSPFQIIQSFFDALTGSGGDGMAKTVIFKVRLPRILLALAAGAGLACSGRPSRGFFQILLPRLIPLGWPAGLLSGLSLP